MEARVKLSLSFLLLPSLSLPVPSLYTAQYLCQTFVCLTHKSRSVQFSSVAQSCPTLCDPMNRSTPGLPVHHQIPEFTQTLVHQVGDAQM